MRNQRPITLILIALLTHAIPASGQRDSRSIVDSRVNVELADGLLPQGRLVAATRDLLMLMADAEASQRHFALQDIRSMKASEGRVRWRGVRRGHS